MAQDDLLSQAEIDALLNGGSDSGDQAQAPSKGPRVRPYNPATQQRVIRERLQGLDLINQRFGRNFRVALFNLIRRSADITVESMKYVGYRDFVRNVPVPTNLNLVTLKPLHGTALIVFPPNLIYMVVDNLFGGDGRFMPKSEGKDFTNTEQRIIRRILNLAMTSYQQCWETVYPMEMVYLRSEAQAKFANITNSPNEIIIETSFHIDVGNLSTSFQICLPYSMIEPIWELLVRPNASLNDGSDKEWVTRMAGGLRKSQVQLVVEFVSIPIRLRQLTELKIGDVLPVDLPDSVTASVDGVPLLECAYGRHQGQIALRVKHLIDHTDAGDITDDGFAARVQSSAEEHTP